MSQSQINEVVDYAIVNYTNLSMDRVELLSKVSGRNILDSIKIYRSAQED
jgi:hypothetical protein